MENNKVFTYRYSAKQNAEVENIRNKYIPKQVSKLDMLKELDRRVQNAGLVQSLVLGIIGCLIFGVGMCFALDVFAGQDFMAVILCILGAAIMIPAYPVYRHIYEKTKAELTPEILRLSGELMKQKN
ncbi:MAG: hypothetical protein IJY27_00645 [Clostridia bacterium]|nr:hypothetical protein [Clostridia bacterium]